MMRSTLPTSHGFRPKGGKDARNPLPPSTKGEFVNNFEFVGSIANTNYLCISEAIKWREQVCGGEKAIMDYCITLTKEGGKAAAKILGTQVLDNQTGTLTNCCLVNVLLPLKMSEQKIEGENTIRPGDGVLAHQFMERTLVADFQTFIVVFYFQGQWWARLTGQIYLDIDDFVWAGKALKKICERVGKGEYLKVEEK